MRRILFKHELTTLKHLAELAGCTTHTVSRLLDEGWTPEEVVAKGAQRGMLRLGDEWITAGQLARRAGLSMSGVSDRLRAGSTPEQILARPHLRERRLYAFRGRELTLGELAKVAVVGVNTLKDRLRRGWDVERAATTPAKTGRPAQPASVQPEAPWIRVNSREMPRTAFAQVDLVSMEAGQVQLKLALADADRAVLLRASQVFDRRQVAGDTASGSLLARLRPVLTGQARYGRGLRQQQRALVEVTGSRVVQRAVDDLRGRLR